MSDSVLILPSSYARNNNLVNQKLIDDTPYYKRAKELINLLFEIVAVIVDSKTGVFEFDPFINNSNTPNRFIGKLLGYIAEGLIVRSCNESHINNRRWANIARVLKGEDAAFSVFNRLRYENQLEISYESIQDNPDDYTAIGTGFIRTKIKYYHLYDRLSPRDICWIHLADDIKELLSVNAVIFNKRRYAGLQIKVSCQEKPDYVIKYFCKQPRQCLYPVIYFDLGNNFHLVRDKLLDIISGKISRQISEHSILNKNLDPVECTSYEIIDALLIRGKDIDPSLHEELEFYRHILEKYISGDISFFDINDDKVIIPLMMEYLALNNFKSKSLKPTTILNLSI